MEREEIKGMLALSGKEWKCYADSTKKEIKELNEGFSNKEIDSIFDLLQGLDDSRNTETGLV